MFQRVNIVQNETLQLLLAPIHLSATFQIPLKDLLSSQTETTGDASTSEHHNRHPLKNTSVAMTKLHPQ